MSVIDLDRAPDHPLAKATDLYMERHEVDSLPEEITVTHLVYRKRMEVGHMMAGGQMMQERLAEFGREAAADIAVEMLHRHLIRMQVQVPRDGGPRDFCEVVARAVLMDPDEYGERVRKEIEDENRRQDAENTSDVGGARK